MLVCWVAGITLPSATQDHHTVETSALVLPHDTSEVCLRSIKVSADILVQGLRDVHAKVRWAACQAVGQLCTDLGPDMQEAEHARLLPGLMSVMDDFSQPRVQAHAAAAVVNFSENCEQVPACFPLLWPRFGEHDCLRT